MCLTGFLNLRSQVQGIRLFFAKFGNYQIFVTLAMPNRRNECKYHFRKTEYF